MPLVILFAWGTGVCLFWGRLGFMPLDQSIVFDGGWRVLHGQVPLRDFHTPNGITPILLQALFFKLLGVSWFTYCLHAAVCNGLFGLVVYFLLKRSGATSRLAFVYASLSVAIFYPAVGTPYLEQHAFFLLLAAIAAALSGEPRSWIAVPVLWVAAFLAKQIPTMLSVPLLLWLLYSTPVAHRRRAGEWLLAGSVLVGTAVFVLALQLGIDSSAWVDLWQRPSQVGHDRWLRLLQPDNLSKNIAILAGVVDADGGVFVWSFLTVILTPAALFHRANPPGRRLFVLAAGLLFICWLFAAVTENHPASGIPYIFLGVGCVHLGLRQTALPATLRRTAEGVVLLVAIADAAAFQYTVNARRIVHDFVYDGQVAERNSPDVPGPIRFMKFAMPDFYYFTAADLNAVVHFFRHREGNLFVLGDTSILYALTGRPSVNPALWFHQGLTLPAADDPRLAQYEAQLLGNFNRQDVRFIVEEQERTWMGTRLSDFPQLSTFLENNTLQRHAIGGFTIVELSR